MMKTIEIEDKTVDDAINAALEQLGVSRDQISVEILEEGTRGLFGIGSKPAKVRVSYGQEAPEPQPPATEPAPTPEKPAPTSAESAPAPAEPAPTPKQEQPPRKPPKHQAKQPSKQPPKQPPTSEKPPTSQDEESPKAAPAEKPAAEPAETPPDSASSAHDDAPREIDDEILEQIVASAKDALATLLAHLQIEYTVEVKKRPEQILLNIHCDNENFLIGRRGTTLDAVQYLVNRIANKDLKEKVQVVLDTSDYRKNRKERLQKLALKLSRKVKMTGKPVTVSPMNPHDRRIIHITLQDDPSVRTMSKGTGFMRRITISANKHANRSRNKRQS